MDSHSHPTDRPCMEIKNSTPVSTFPCFQMPETMSAASRTCTITIGSKQFSNEFWKFDYLPASDSLM